MINPYPFKHGLTRTRPYRIWCGMKERCEKPQYANYKKYGAKGVTVCDKWKDFLGFWGDMEATYFEGATIDRINNSMGYSHDNCRWATMTQQNRNRTNNRLIMLDGKSIPVVQAAELVGIRSRIVYQRLYRGWKDFEALHTPIEKHTVLFAIVLFLPFFLTFL